MIQSRQPTGLRRDQRSQSLVEFSLSLVALIMLISGIIDLGRAFFVITAMEDTAGEGSIFLSQNPECASSQVSGCANPNNAIFRMSSATGGLLAVTGVVDPPSSPNTTPGNAWFQICWPDDPDNAGRTPANYVQCSIVTGGTDIAPSYAHTVGDNVYVEMNYNFQLLSPFIPQIAGGSILPLKVSVTNVLVLK